MSSVYVFFFFKQKTAYEMRISDWSSDVCSSDLLDGTQPTLTQVPPITPWPISATFAPSSAAVIAAEKPAEPAPTTATSYPSRLGRLRQSFIGYRFLKAR